MSRFGRESTGFAVLVTVVLGCLLLSGTATVGARPPPHAICGVCHDDALVSAAAAEGVTVGVAGSSLAVRIDASGTGHWTARVHLTGPGVETLRRNRTLRERVVTRVYERGYVAVENPRSLTASMNGSTLVVEYAVPDMAHESLGGVHVVDFFYWNGGEARWFYLAADTTTIRGPPGTVVSHAPASATVAGDAVTWQGGNGRFHSPLAGRYVAFAPGDGVAGTVATALAIGVDVAQLKAADLIAAVVPGVVLATVVVLLLAFARRLAAVQERHLAAVVLGSLLGIALVAAIAETVVGTSGPVAARIGDFLVYLVLALVATGAAPVVVFGVPLVVGQAILARRLLRTGSSATSGIEPRVERLLVWPAVAVLGAQWLLVPLAAAGAAGYDSLYGVASLVVPVVVFLPLAVTHRRNGPLRFALAAGVAFAAIPPVIALAPHARVGFVVDRSLPTLYVPWALAVAAIGTLAYARGSRLIADVDGVGTG